MRNLIITIIWITLDLYCYQALKTIVKDFKPKIKSIIKKTYWIVEITLMSIVLSIILYFSKFTSSYLSNWIIGFSFISLAPKIIILLFLLSEDIIRLLRGSFNFLSLKFTKKEKIKPFIPGRRKFVSQISFGLASIPFFGLVYGVFKGKYEYRVHRVKLAFKDLPEAFEGLTITQLSDIHSGSFHDQEAVLKGIKLVNSQKSDILFFTGDLVNNKAEEMNDWIDSFSLLAAKMGKYSILGNHDYGDYWKWNNEEEKVNNLIRLKEIHAEIGFKLLLNENLKIEKDGQSISLVGVENWGMRGFHKHGDLEKALKGVEKDDFKILLSHDPSHWEAQTLDHEKHIHLTLSGHTHGMQFGIEIPGFIKWSPIKYLYPQWAGAYERKGKYIYVNRGFGFLGYPGRVGILPEITVIQLSRG